MLKSEPRRDEETLVSNLRPRLNNFFKSRPEMPLFKNPSTRRRDQEI